MPVVLLYDPLGYRRRQAQLLALVELKLQLVLVRRAQQEH